MIPFITKTLLTLCHIQIALSTLHDFYFFFFLLTIYIKEARIGLCFMAFPTQSISVLYICSPLRQPDLSSPHFFHSLNTNPSSRQNAAISGVFGFDFI